MCFRMSELTPPKREANMTCPMGKGRGGPEQMPCYNYILTLLLQVSRFGSNAQPSGMLEGAS
jgi:hypothetical protein